MPLNKFDFKTLVSDKIVPSISPRKDPFIGQNTLPQNQTFRQFNLQNKIQQLIGQKRMG